jgi:hypothetical protein
MHTRLAAHNTQSNPQLECSRGFRNHSAAAFQTTSSAKTNPVIAIFCDSRSATASAQSLIVAIFIHPLLESVYAYNALSAAVRDVVLA